MIASHGALSSILNSAAVLRIGGGNNARNPATHSLNTPERDFHEVERDLVLARGAAAGMAVFVGGEPTLNRHLPRLLGACREVGIAAGVVTNGRALFYPRVRRRLLVPELRYLQVGLHGAVAATHDRVVGVAGAFEQVTTGLAGLLREGSRELFVEVACCPTGTNLGELVALSEILADFGGSPAVGLRFVAPLTGVKAEDWVPAAEISDRLAAALSGVVLPVAWEGFAPCLLEEHASLRDERLRYGVPAYGLPLAGTAFADERVDAWLLHNPDYPARSHPIPCQDCVHEATCPGAPAPLLQHEGERALRPTRAVRANSFNYEFDRTLENFRLRAGRCSATRLDLGGAPLCRRLLLARDGEVDLYHCPANDFTDREIGVVKDDLEQVYFDLSAGAALDDFVTAVRRARLHPECHACPDRERCPTAVRVDPDPPFTAEETWLRREVSRARGRVLDVGCGEQPYREELAALIREARIDYHGLDPDAGALARFRGAGVGGTLHEGTIEEFEAADESFDIILAFRSFNHFFDLERAFAQFARLLRSGGTLYLCDSPPFAMLRTSAQVAFADENAPFGHEHYRNWRSEQVLDLMGRFPFKVRHHRPVTPATSNLWLIKASRDSRGRKRG